MSLFLIFIGVVSISKCLILKARQKLCSL